jgi:uncharacterized protein
MHDQVSNGVAVFTNVMIPMRDGVRLAADIYLPSDGMLLRSERYGTILLRTSYDKTSQRYVEPIGRYFCRRGFAVVLQDLRGRAASEGVGQYFHTANEHDGTDGYDTVEWIAAQPWSNGRVGMVGSSHPALVATRAALHRPPHLTALWPDVSPINSYHHQVRMGGAMQLQMFGALFVHAHDAPEIRDDPAAQRAIVAAMGQMRELVYATPFKPGHTPLAVVPNLERTLINYATRGAYDAFWAAEHSDFERRFADHADIPMTFTGGWFDLFAEATPRYYAAMAAQNRSPQRLIMGPWTHTSMRAGLTYSGDVDFGPASAWGIERFNAEQLRWFARWLHDEPTGVENDPPVQIFVMGGGSGRRTAAGKLDHGGRWRAEQAWPLARAVPTPFYLQPGGGLATNPAPGDAPPVHFRYDPAHPVPTIAASSSGLMEVLPLTEGLDEFWSQSLPLWPRMRSIVIEGGAHQQEQPGMIAARPPYLPLSMRPDVLVFQTEPLSADIEVTGAITVQIYIASSAPDTDVTAKLIDVYPPNADYPEGYHLGLVDGIIRCRYRESFEREVMMEPGRIYPVTIRLAPTSNLFKAGHRIRIDISSSNFPRFDRNPNTGEPMGRHTRMQPADNTVYCDAAHPSHVVLPIVR